MASLRPSITLNPPGTPAPREATSAPVLTLHTVVFPHPTYQVPIGSKKLTKLIKEIDRLKVIHHESVVAIHDCQLAEPTSSAIATVDSHHPLHTPPAALGRTASTPAAINHSASPSATSSAAPASRDAVTVLYVVMDNLDAGISLTQALQSCGAFAWSQVKLYTKQLLFALLYIHSNGFLHKDLCADNILLTQDHRHQRSAKLMFVAYQRTLLGLHQQYPSTLYQPHRPSLPLWLVPEEADEASLYTKKTDVYGLGIVVLQMVLGLDGVHAFNSLHQCLYAVRSLVPPAMVDTLGRMLAVERKHRPTALELLAEPLFRQVMEEHDERIPALYLLGQVPSSLASGQATPRHWPDTFSNDPSSAGDDPFIAGDSAPVGPSILGPIPAANATAAGILSANGLPSHPWPAVQPSLSAISSLAKVPRTPAHRAP
ncbi:eukaryotic translation initiation factor 2-alpha kinase, partial [Dimargaris verticillata]